MRPVFNPRPSKAQPHGASQHKQVMDSNNKFQTNPTSLLPQLGLMNPSNLNNNGFLNVPNNQFFQNGVFPLGQFSNGFVPNNFNNMGLNQFNLSQLSGQILAQNLMNQGGGGGIGFPNGQFLVQNAMQNMGQFAQMPMGVNVPFMQNQVRGPQNPSFNGNQQFGVMNFNGVPMQSNQQQNAANGNQQLQGNSSVQPVFGSVQPQQTQNFQTQGFNNQQGNPRNDNVNNNMSNNGGNSQSRNFEKRPKQDRSQGFAKSQNHHMQNGKGRFKNANGRMAKSYQNECAGKSGPPDSSNAFQVEKKRFLPLNYTEQEIHQWREARKRHYPSKSNIDKKSKKKMAESEVVDTEAKLRRQQLKEVLVKQAELGCEVAEIPSHYLSDSEKQVPGAEQDRPAFNKGKFRNRFNKRGRHEKDRFAKKQRPSNNDPANTNDQNVSNQVQRTRNNATSIVQKREPTLLQKLLSADVRRDRDRMLQAFRFMVMNSFFKDQPEKPLMFPTVIVREFQSEGQLMELKHAHVGDGNGSQVHEMKNVSNAESGVSSMASAGAQEEEGEIID